MITSAVQAPRGVLVEDLISQMRTQHQAQRVREKLRAAAGQEGSVVRRHGVVVAVAAAARARACGHGSYQQPQQPQQG